MSFEKGHVPWNKRIPRSEKTKQKIRETKSKQVNWNKGLTKETDERLVRSEAFRKRIRETSLGRPGWNKGLTKETDERIKQGGEELRKTLAKPEVKERWVVAHKGINAGPKNTNWGKCGVASPFWKGGISPLSVKVRNCHKYRQWRSDIFTRDDFTCQECGRRGGALRAHHTPDTFAFIMEINDIKTFDQAMECEELWNINNGITYCTKCHGIKEKELRGML